MSTAELVEGTDLSRSKAELGMRKNDKNSDGKLDKKEFAAMMNSRQKRKHRL